MIVLEPTHRKNKRFLLITSYKHGEIVWRVLSKHYETTSCNSCLYSHFHANRFVKLGFFLLYLHLIWTKNKRTKTITAFIFRIDYIERAQLHIDIIYYTVA